MKRRAAFLVVVAAAWRAAPPVYAQKIFRIGVLSYTTPREKYVALPAALLELGWKEGHNYVFDFRSAEGRDDLLPGFATELVKNKVDLIVASGTPAALAAKRATSTIPVVMFGVGAPVETGLIASLAHPGGNLTGTAWQSPALAGKVLEVLHDAVPKAIRVTVLVDREVASMDLYLVETERAAKAMGIRLTILPGQTLAEIEAAFVAITRARPDALYVVPTGAITMHQARVVEFAARERIPAVYTTKQPVLEGGLLSYVLDVRPLIQRTAAIIDRVLKGARPADVPVEQPTRYELTINLKAAKSLGLSIPQSLLLRADEVIQ